MLHTNFLLVPEKIIVLTVNAGMENILNVIAEKRAWRNG